MTPSGSETQSNGAGRRILVVEDEAAIAMLLEDMLLDLGYETVGPIGRLAPAMEIAEREPLHAAIVDVNVAGEVVYPLVEILARREVAFVFSTGYGRPGIEEPWRDRPVLPKPFSQEELALAIEAAIGVG